MRALCLLPQSTCLCYNAATGAEGKLLGTMRGKFGYLVAKVGAKSLTAGQDLAIFSISNLRFSCSCLHRFWTREHGRGSLFLSAETRATRSTKGIGH